MTSTAPDWISFFRISNSATISLILEKKKRRGETFVTNA